MSAVLSSDIFTFDDDDNANNSNVSPTTALFPPSLSFPGLDALDALDHPYLSPTSLSPHSANLSSDHSHLGLSPPGSSDSPSSSLSFATDEYLLNSSFGNDDLDLLIFPEDNTNQAPFPSLPTFQLNMGSPELNVKPMVDMPMQRPNVNSASGVPMGAIQPPAFDGLLHQWRQNLSQQAQMAPMPWLGQIPTHNPLQAMPVQPMNMQAPPPPPPQFQQPVPQTTSVTPPPQQKVEPAAQLTPPSSANPPPRRSAPNAPLNKRQASPTPNVGKHNKTERRYRQKVQQAQADLRDAVPALRVLYGTSTEEQKRATDVRASDGTVDGLGEVTRPNASAKATILIGARMYIELLQRRTASLQRKVNELETWRSAVAGADDLNAWRRDFEVREAAILAKLQAEAAAKGDDSDELESEEEEEAAPRKRARTTAKKVKAEPVNAVTNSKISQGVRGFAAFAVSFSVLPSASKLFNSAPTAAAAQEGSSAVFSGELARHQVLARLPLITAEHTSRLLSRALPTVLVPSANTIVDWTMRLLATITLLAVVGPVLQRASRSYQHKGTGAGNLIGLGQEAIKTTIGTPVENDAEWNNLAARIVGGLDNSSMLTRLHVTLRLRRSKDPYSLALLALLAPEKTSSIAAWVEARNLCEPDTALAEVLTLPLDEASRLLDLVPPTAAPIAAIAEQNSLAHLYVLYTHFFARLVAAVGDATALPPMLRNVQRSELASEIKSLGREIAGVLQGVSRHSSSHALGLVLLGLWGLFSGYQSPAALVSALATEEAQGCGASLSSVSALLELLYPGSSNQQAQQAPNSTPISSNALALDKLAMACIGFVDLLFSSSSLSTASPTISRVERMEINGQVQKEAARLRLVLTEANFEGVDDADAQDTEQTVSSATSGPGASASKSRPNPNNSGDNAEFEDARQKLVSVLYNVGRRAAGRTVWRDDDSGMEDDGEGW